MKSSFESLKEFPFNLRKLEANMLKLQKNAEDLQREVQSMEEEVHRTETDVRALADIPTQDNEQGLGNGGKNSKRSRL